MEVPFLDLKAQLAPIRGEVDAALSQVLDSAAFVAGPFTAAFERDFAAFVGTRHAIGVSNGTCAVWLALKAVGVGPGDEVITVPNTFIATVEAITFAGATPVLVDVREADHNMDPDLLAASITPRTKAVVPVHLYGQTADMDPIIEIARARGIKVIEDAAQAHGAEYNGRRAGTMGDAGCFSFYPGKNLGAYGEAGAVTTDSDEIASAIRMVIDHGQEAKYRHRVIGWNARMDGMQGAILGVKLRSLEKWNEGRRDRARRYLEELSGIAGLRAPMELVGRRHIYHVFSARFPGRDGLMDHLRNSGVGCAIHYPVPIHLTPAYAHMGLARGSFPVAERLADEIVSLPMFAELTDDQIAHVASSIREYTH